MTCKSCYRQRRKFFVESGTLHLRSYSLDLFIVVSWVKRINDRDWWFLIECSRSLSKKVSGKKFGHYIRVLSMGKEKLTPHIHYISDKKGFQLIYEQAKNTWGRSVRISKRPITFMDGALGYLFDQNFKVSYLDLSRPKRVRLLTASRPMVTGHPSGLQLKALRFALIELKMKGKA